MAYLPICAVYLILPITKTSCVNSSALSLVDAQLHSFPYVKTRIAVMFSTHVDLNPLMRGHDEMVEGAESGSCVPAADVRMNSSCSSSYRAHRVQVNAGPLAYARAFLDDASTKKYPDNKVKQLKEVFRVALCVACFLIVLVLPLFFFSSPQISAVDDGMRSPLPDSLHIFNAISGTPTAASIQGLPNSSSVV
ncbi:hypothetical protein cypCar_00011629 [Cyprinus carpio]|nr:hypothetical protein cypCar_00011629 [Cyprinus carpio]